LFLQDINSVIMESSSEYENSARNDNVASNSLTQTITRTQPLRLFFRQVIPTDITACFQIEKASYPRNEAATKSALQYRQHFAEKYFRCCVLTDDQEEEEDSSVNTSSAEATGSSLSLNNSNHHVEDQIVGFICATRCRIFTEEAMATHDATGPLLAIHSVVVAEPYRRRGIATFMMKNYIETMESMADGVEKFVMISKNEHLGFYVNCGFSVLRPSDIVHGREQWFHLERPKEVGAPCWVVDAFAENAGEGNPAAVVLLKGEPDNPEWCQAVAREFNLSETAFIWKCQSEQTTKSHISSDHYGIRYFTCDGSEVDLCGHATLASAAVLFQQSSIPTITFHSKFDQLITSPAKFGSSKKMQVSMNFPLKELVQMVVMDDNRSILIKILQRAFPKIQERLESNLVFIGVDVDGDDLLVEITPELFRDIGHEDGDVVHSALLEWNGYRRGVIVCCQMDEEEEDGDRKNVDFVSRFFGPKCGIPEDPVTGSAHCILAPYFAQKLGKSELKAEQRSLRGGKITCILENYRVNIVGSAILIMSGTTWV
jgi:PhzF family phenazine biosynthesis protein